MSKEHTERFLELMSFSSAPINPISILMDLDELDADDLTPAVFLEELEMVERFASRGLHAFSQSLRVNLEQQRRRNDLEPVMDALSSDEKDIELVLPPTGKYVDRCNVALNLTAYLVPFYLKRLKRLSEAIERVADTCRKSHFGDMTPEVADELRRLSAMIEKGARPKNSGNLQDICDLTRGLKWYFEMTRAMTSSIREVPDLKSQTPGRVGFRETATELLNGERLEAPLKATSGASSTQSFSRRKQRNPTGFAKFNFADLQAMDAEDQLETPTSERSCSRLGATPSGPASRFRRDSSDMSRESFKLRQHSSIDESKTIEIEDKLADPEWHDKKRKESREVRVRRRIPTGHPSMMKSALVARASLELEDDEETKVNTELNENIV